MKSSRRISQNITPIPNTIRTRPCSLLQCCVAVVAGLVLVARINAADSSDVFYGAGAGGSTTTGSYNTAVGYYALTFETGGNYNTAIGGFALDKNTTGNTNTAIGYSALFNNTTGTNNMAGGSEALKSNTTGAANTANGGNALSDNIGGRFNTATGYQALSSNTNGDENTATGGFALFLNTSGDENTANGFEALFNNTTGNYNVASGYQALNNNTTGSNNEAAGYNALYSNTTGVNNMANGASALYGNTTGFYNMANGSFAMAHNTKGSYNVAEGLNALFSNTTGSNNIAIGLAAGGNLTTGSGNIDIGNRGVAAEGNTIRIGSTQNRTFLAGVRNAVAAGGVAVYASATGQLGTNPSSKRFKQDIADMDEQSEVILNLRPVSFHYKEELDPAGTAQFGLIAEEVAKVNPELVARDDKGEIYSVRYEVVNAMLLNEFLKEHGKVRQLETSTIKQQQEFVAAIARQQEQISELTNALHDQAMQIRRVNARLAAQKPAAELVAANH